MNIFQSNYPIENKEFLKVLLVFVVKEMCLRYFQIKLYDFLIYPNLSL